MTPHHHLNDDTLALHAAGSLPAGPALVAAIHLDGCAQCRMALAALDMAGGVLLADLPPAAMSEHALARAMAAIETPLPQPTAAAPPPPLRRPALPDDAILPARLAPFAIGRWRWLAPGIRWSRVHVPAAHANVVLLHGRAGSKLPHHRHVGGEYTQVLTGALREDDIYFRAGDCIDAEHHSEHRLHVTDDHDCLCVAAIDGHTQVNSLIGRLVAPLLAP